MTQLKLYTEMFLWRSADYINPNEHRHVLYPRWCKISFKIPTVDTANLTYNNTLCDNEHCFKKSFERFFCFLDNPLAVISKGIFYLQSTDLLFDKFKINTSKSDKEIRRVQRTGYTKY